MRVSGNKHSAKAMQACLPRTIAIVIVSVLIAGQASAADDLPRKIFEAWKARHESTRSLEATFEGTRFTPANNYSHLTLSGKYVVVPKTDRQDSMRCSFALSSPSRLYFEITTTAFNPRTLRYEPNHSVMAFTKTTVENLSRYDSTGKGDWQNLICGRSNYADSGLRLDGAEAAQLLLVYRPFQFENIASFSAEAVRTMRVITESVEVGGRNCVILRGVCPQGPGRGYKYELVVTRDPLFLPLRITVARPQQSLDKPISLKQFTYDNKGVLSAWHAKSWDPQGRLRYAEDATVTSLVRNRPIGKKRFKIAFPRGCPNPDRLAGFSGDRHPRNRRHRLSWILIIAGITITCVAFLVHCRRKSE